MEKIQKVSAVEGWTTRQLKGLRVQVKLKRRTLGDKTLKARFGVGEVATPLFDFVAAEEVVWGRGACGYLTA